MFSYQRVKRMHLCCVLGFTVELNACISVASYRNGVKYRHACVIGYTHIYCHVNLLLSLAYRLFNRLADF